MIKWQLCIASDLFGTGKFSDKTSQIAKEIQTFKGTKNSGSMFYADISKSKEISRWQPIDEALYEHFSTTKKFSKIATIVLQKD